MNEKKISQIGASTEGRAFLRKLAGRTEDSGAKMDENIGPSALFSEMKDAYRALFVYGLIKGERLPIQSNFNTIYANIGMFEEEYSLHSLIRFLGEERDLEDIGKAINEYTNWAICELIDEFGNEDFTTRMLIQLIEKK